jgi:positive regulator of sigma E activity
VKQNGIVRSAEGGSALVVLTGSEGCASCSGRGSCGILSGGARKPREVRVLDPIGASPGDLVELELPPQRALLAIFLLFILPVIGLLAALLVTPSSASQPVRALYVLGGMAVGILLGTTIARAHSRSKDFDMSITAVLGRPSCSTDKGGGSPGEVSCGS